MQSHRRKTEVLYVTACLQGKSHLAQSCKYTIYKYNLNEPVQGEGPVAYPLAVGSWFFTPGMLCIRGLLMHEHGSQYMPMPGRLALTEENITQIYLLSVGSVLVRQLLR